MLVEHDDALLAAYVDDETGLDATAALDALAAQTKQALVHPVFFGSAITGAGVEPLMAGIAGAAAGRASAIADGPVSGTVFKIERGSAGEKIAYVRMFSGTVRTRDRLHFGRDDEEQGDGASAVFDARRRRPAACGRPAGEIAKLWGLGGVQIGDAIGDAPQRAVRAASSRRRRCESVVAPRDARTTGQRLRIALAQLAEQDPLINVRQDEPDTGALGLALRRGAERGASRRRSQATTASTSTFRETTPIYVERPLRQRRGGRAPARGVESVPRDDRPADRARAERLGNRSSGSTSTTRTVPLYVYKTRDEFAEQMERVRASTRCARASSAGRSSTAS